MIAGGVDYGEAKTALANSKNSSLKPTPRGLRRNSAVRTVREFSETRPGGILFITENVYQKIDSLNVEPARKIIHSVFEKHITEAPGMERSGISSRKIIYSGAVMKAALSSTKPGGPRRVDVGGADRRVSVSEEWKHGPCFPPWALRETDGRGDLGVFVNKDNHRFARQRWIKKNGIQRSGTGKAAFRYEKIPSPGKSPCGTARGRGPRCGNEKARRKNHQSHQAPGERRPRKGRT